METVCKNKKVDYGKPRVMGVLNLTPDSFHDGGKYTGDMAFQRIFHMIDDGADFIDIGGASSRPGAAPVSAEVELERVIPFLKEVSSSVTVPISIDTMKTEVAYAALDAGADMINDMNALRSGGMMGLAASTGVPVIIGHMNGTPETMNQNPISDVSQIADFLKERKVLAEEHGIKQIILDPGVGFGKTLSANLEIISKAREFSFGCPVMIGCSYKSFLESVYPGIPLGEASLEASLKAVKSGANIIRVHDVRDTVEALREI